MSQIYYTVPNPPQQHQVPQTPMPAPIQQQYYHQQPMMAPAPRKQNPVASFFRGVGNVFRWLLLAFHHTAVALSWIYILIPFLGWNRYSRILLGYIGLTFFSVSTILFIYNLLSGNLTIPQTY